MAKLIPVSAEGRSRHVARGRACGSAVQALNKASLLVLAERDLRARETEQIRADLNAIYEVLERSRRDRELRLSALVR